MPSRRQFLTAAATSPAVVAVSPTSAPAAAPSWPTGPGQRTTPQQPDRELRTLLGELDQRRIEASVRKLVSFGTRHTLSSQTDPVRGIGAARDWIFNEFRSYPGKLAVELQSFVQPPGPRIPVPTTITNVLATLKGSRDPDRIYVVSGHYDSRASDVMNATIDAPGADDDASGVAAVMEIARVLATRSPDATIIFAAVAGEEQGLFGAAHLASKLTGVQAMFTNDIVGACTPATSRIVRLFAEGVPTSETPEQAAIRRSVGGENDSPSRQLARFVTDIAGTGMTVEVIHRRDRYLRGGDHIPFLERGFPAARFTEPVEDFAHQHQDVRVENGVRYGDLVEFCDFGYTTRVARVNAAVLWSLATAPGTPRGVRIRTNRLTNETDLVWDAVPGVSYEVVWRPTDAADWTHRIPVGAVGAHTVALSKDNVFFGVRAVGAGGRRSPVTFPVPAP